MSIEYDPLLFAFFACCLIMRSDVAIAIGALFAKARNRWMVG